MPPRYPGDALYKQLQGCNNPDCQKSDVELQKCSECKTARYCSKECQKADWQDHKPICRLNQGPPDCSSLEKIVMKQLREFCSRHLPSLRLAALLALDHRKSLQHVVHISVVQAPNPTCSERSFTALCANVRPFESFGHWGMELHGHLVDQTNRWKRSGYLGCFMVIVTELKTSTVLCAKIFPFTADVLMANSGLPWQELVLCILNLGRVF